MTSRQNYETIDRAQLTAETYLKLSRVFNEKHHFVVACYQGNLKLQLGTNWLKTAYHFIGHTAESDALNYFMSKIEPEEFKPQPLDSYKSYRPDKTFIRKERTNV